MRYQVWIINSELAEMVEEFNNEKEAIEFASRPFREAGIETEYERVFYTPKLNIIEGCYGFEVNAVLEVVE